MAPKAIEFLDKVIESQFQILEWGSGGSTAWFAKRAKLVTSVESNREWFERVSHNLKSNHIHNVDYRLIEVDETLNEEQSLKKGQIPPYVSIVHAYPENHFDMVIVDGAHRNICIHQAPKYIKPGGYLVLDNSNWMSHEKWGIPKNWHVVSHDDVGVSCTTVWQKPVQ
jgi:predicted O-methyltransferase YrrM